MKRPLTGKLFAILIALASVSCASVVLAGQPRAEQIEFFEKKIRPLLANNRYECHSAQAKSPFAGLRLDSREGARKGGESGPAVIPGKPHESRLIQRIQGKPVLMPPTGPLKDKQIALLIKWVEMGAPWTEEASAQQANQAAAFNLEERKRNHWAWQPVRPAPHLRFAAGIGQAYPSTTSSLPSSQKMDWSPLRLRTATRSSGVCRST